MGGEKGEEGKMEEENDQEKKMLEKKQKRLKKNNGYHSSQWVPYSEGTAWCWTG